MYVKLLKMNWLMVMLMVLMAIQVTKYFDILLLEL